MSLVAEALVEKTSSLIETAKSAHGNVVFLSVFFGVLAALIFIGGGWMYCVGEAATPPPAGGGGGGER